MSTRSGGALLVAAGILLEVPLAFPDFLPKGWVFALGLVALIAGMCLIVWDAGAN